MLQFPTNTCPYSWRFWIPKTKVEQFCLRISICSWVSSAFHWIQARVNRNLQTNRQKPRTNKRLESWEITMNLTLNSPKFSSPGSWKDPQLPNWIPERKKFRVKVAAMEQKSCGSRTKKKKKEEAKVPKIKIDTDSSSLRLMPGERNWLWKGSAYREPRHKSPLSHVH